MKKPLGSALTLGLAILLAALGRSAAHADEPDFYRGKTIELVISTGPGGGLDSNARIVARHLADHIPGHPTIVARNMPGAGHLRAANYIYNEAPKDGTTIGTLIPAFVLAQILDGRGVQFDAAKFQWLVSTSSSNSTVYVWGASDIKSVEDAMKRDVLMGGTGIGSYTTLYPTIMNNILKTRFKIIAGYQSSAEVNLAMQRGEVQGRAGNNFNSLKAENGQWLKDGTIRLIAQVGLNRDPEFPDVPLISDFAKNDSDRRILRLFSTDVVIGRPFLTSPGVPPDHVAILRKAFDEMLKDPAFLKESAEAGLDVNPVPGDKIQGIVADLVNTPPEIIAEAKAAMVAKD
ncbi:MAG TPA: tripartite tricarboxylate transporter substrate-binding protein, partial [Beijerinckiaceae bacterium]|nr:tripartite tricarboxylate transporter substrate-binding protein [Beijerinckiaceae bacterium]